MIKTVFVSFLCAKGKQRAYFEKSSSRTRQDFIPHETTGINNRSACNITPGRETRDEPAGCGGLVCLAKIHVEQLSKDAGILIPELILLHSV